MSPKLFVLIALCALAVFINNADSATTSQADQVGCFWDNPADRPLKMWIGRVSTPEECVLKCKKANQPYAAIQAGWGCRCGRDFYKYGFANNCNVKCSKGGLCGGDNSNSIYNVVAVKAGTAVGVTVGCFSGTSKYRPMNMKMLIGRVVTAGECVQKCKNRNQPYAAIQGGWECSCGKNFYKYGFASNCNMICRAAGGLCGGDNSQSIYRVAESKTVGVGCFLDNPKNRAFTMWIGRVSTPEQCVQKCKKANKPYAAIQAGWGCRCGTNFYKHGFADNCNMKCKAGGLCGGYNSNSIYKVD